MDLRGYGASMSHSSDAVLPTGIALPGARLLGQIEYSVSLAEADDPELASCGWGVFRTESLRRRAAHLERGLAQATQASETPEDLMAARIYDGVRRSQELLETVDVYGQLAFESEGNQWQNICPTVGPGALNHYLSALRQAQKEVYKHRDILRREGLHPMIPHRLQVEQATIEWCMDAHEAALTGLTVTQREIAILKGTLYTTLKRLNAIGRLAYRHDASHQARYNLEVLDGRLPLLSGAQLSHAHHTDDGLRPTLAALPT